MGQVAFEFVTFPRFQSAVIDDGFGDVASLVDRFVKSATSQAESAQTEAGAFAFGQ